MIALLEAKGAYLLLYPLMPEKLTPFPCGMAIIPLCFSTPRKQRNVAFDAAHELGHLVMYRHGAPQRRRRKGQCSRVGLLMPRRVLLLMRRGRQPVHHPTNVLRCLLPHVVPASLAQPDDRLDLSNAMRLIWPN